MTAITEAVSRWVSEDSAAGNEGGKLDVVDLPRETRRAMVADGSVRGGVLVEALSPGDGFDAVRAQAAVDAIRERAARVRAGDLSGVTDDLVAQAGWLGAVCEYATRRATAEGITPGAAEIWWRLAMRAATANVRTSGALAGIVMAQGRAVEPLADE